MENHHHANAMNGKPDELSTGPFLIAMANDRRVTCFHSLVSYIVRQKPHVNGANRKH